MSLSRRNLAIGSAWAVPTVIVASAAPSVAASLSGCGSAGANSVKVFWQNLPTHALAINLYVAVVQSGVVVATYPLGTSAASVYGGDYTFTGLPIGAPYEVYVTESPVSVGALDSTLTPSTASWTYPTDWEDLSISPEAVNCLLSDGHVYGYTATTTGPSGCDQVFLGGTNNITCNA